MRDDDDLPPFDDEPPGDRLPEEGGPEETPGEAAAAPARRRARLALGALGLATAAALLGASAGFGTRLGLWHFGTGFQLLRWAAYGAIAAAAVSAGALYLSRPGSGRRGFALALLALVVSLAVLAVPLWHRQAAGDAPPIHDITTDVANPPEFVAIVPLREDAANPVEYEGEEVARLQREAYPDIRPLVLDLPFDRAFQRALDAAGERGWTLVDQDAEDGRIEATARTFWFGFRDDVVIRLTALDGRTVVDVRSKSRVGRGDMGANARRVRDYLEELGG